MKITRYKNGSMVFSVGERAGGFWARIGKSKAYSNHSLPYKWFIDLNHGLGGWTEWSQTKKEAVRLARLWIKKKDVYILPLSRVLKKRYKLQ